MAASPGRQPKRPGQPAPTYDRSSIEFGRGISFFDAIYGFAITLLITNIDLPPAQSWSSLSALLDSGLIPQVFGFLLSFVVIAVFWRVNYRITAGIRLMTPSVITWNIIAAVFIILLPFTTQGTSDPGTSRFALPTALYAVNIGLAHLAQTAILFAARRQVLPRGSGKVFFGSLPVIFAASPGPGRLVWASLLMLGPLTGEIPASSQRGM